MAGPTTTIAAMLAAPGLGLQVLARPPSAVCLAREVDVPRIQKPGLALTGWPEQLHRHRVLVLGGTEVDYFAQCTSDARARGVATILNSAPAAIVLTRARTAPPELVAACDAAEIALLGSTLVTAEFIVAVTSWLQQALSPSLEMHGVLLDVSSIGILLLGKSGIGKSETALDLVVRGHRLVADDVVKVQRRGDTVLGTGAALIKHHMEIRGIGIINIKDLYGIAAVREAKKIEVVVELVEWDDAAVYDRLGIEDHLIDILGARLPHVVLPVRPGRNLATLVEVAARNQLLKIQGHHSARAFQQRINAALGHSTAMAMAPDPAVASGAPPGEAWGQSEMETAE